MPSYYAQTLALGALPYLAAILVCQLGLRPSLPRQLGAILASNAIAWVPIQVGHASSAGMGLGNLVVMFFAIAVLVLSYVTVSLAFHRHDALSRGEEPRGTRALVGLSVVTCLLVAGTCLFVFDQVRPR